MAITFASNYGLNWGTPSGLNDLDPISLTAWIYPTGWGGGSLGRILAKEGYVGGQWGWLWYLRSTSGEQTLEFQRYRATTTANVRAANSSISLNTWQHVVATYASSGSDLYIDGVQPSYSNDVAGSGAINSDSAQSGYTGRNSGTVRGFAGLIEDVRIYSRALSLAEAKTIYTGQGHDSVREGLLARWPQREKAPGTTISTDSAYDITNNQYTATPTSASLAYAEGLISLRKRV